MSRVARKYPEWKDLLSYIRSCRAMRPYFAYRLSPLIYDMSQFLTKSCATVQVASHQGHPSVHSIPLVLRFLTSSLISPKISIFFSVAFMKYKSQEAFPPFLPTIFTENPRNMHTNILFIPHGYQFTYFISKRLRDSLLFPLPLKWDMEALIPLQAYQKRECGALLLVLPQTWKYWKKQGNSPHSLVIGRIQREKQVYLISHSHEEATMGVIIPKGSEKMQLPHLEFTLNT